MLRNNSDMPKTLKNKMVSGNPRPYSNATNENEKIAIDRLYSGEGG